MNPLRLIYLLPLWLLLSAGCNESGKREGDIRKVISTDKAPEAAGPYSQAILAGNTLYLAGQVGLDPQKGELAGESLETQTRQALRNIEVILEAAGFSLGEVVDVQVFLTDVGMYSAFNTLYAEWFGDNPPARTLVEVSNLPIGAKVEIKVTAVKAGQAKN